MKIQATCGTCDRTFLLSQIGPGSDSPGRCPFCGARFARHYTATLVDTVAGTEVAAAQFAAAFERLHSMETGFRIDTEALLASLGEQIRDIEQEQAAS